MKIFTYAAYKRDFGTLGYIADAVKYYLNRDARNSFGVTQGAGFEKCTVDINMPAGGGKAVKIEIAKNTEINGCENRITTESENKNSVSITSDNGCKAEIFYRGSVPIVEINEYIDKNRVKKGQSGAGVIYASVSHSGNYLVIGVAETVLGADIENIKLRNNYKRIADKIGFECSNLKDFYRGWTEYEARYKAQCVQAVYGEYFGLPPYCDISELPARRYEIFPDTIMTVIGSENAEFIPMESFY